MKISNTIRMSKSGRDSRWVSSPQLSNEVKAVCHRMSQQLQRDLPNLDKVAIYLSGGASVIWSLWEEASGNGHLSGPPPPPPGVALLMETSTTEWLAERGWMARLLPHRSFPVGLLFVKMHPQVGSSNGDEPLNLDEPTKLRIKQFAKRLTTMLMQTKQMRERFHDYRVSFKNTQRLLMEAKAEEATPVAVKPSKRVINHDLEEVVVEPSDMISKNLDQVICPLAFPLMASLAMEPVFSLIDTFYIGKKLGSTTCLSAFGLSGK